MKTSVALALTAEPQGRKTGGHAEPEDSVPPELPKALVEDLGRILGEALVEQLQRDTGDMSTSPRGIDHTQEAENDDGGR